MPETNALTLCSRVWSDALLPAPFRAAFSAREGGASSGAYNSNNMALHVGDDPRRVRENRRELLRSFNLDPNRAIVAEQIHGSAALLVDDADAGSGCFSHKDSIVGTDALVTATPGLPLLCMSADCLLLALCEPQARLVAVVHAGWRGLAEGVIESTITLMKESGAKPGLITAAGTPSIGPCCFEVGSEVVRALGDEHAAFSLDEKVSYDLRAAARGRLLKAGLSAAGIQIDSACTCCREDMFFSHRRTTKRGSTHTGRMGLLVWID